jgi:hypothetical protein
VALAAAAITSIALPGPGTRGSAQTPAAPLTRAYLLAFHGCDTAVADCMDFRNHAVYLAESDDGATWSLPAGYTPAPGSVPDVVRRGDAIYLFSPGQVRPFRLSTGTWEAQRAVTLLDPECPSFVDPSPLVDEQGRIVLVYLCGGLPGTGDPAGCPTGQTTCVKRFRSATEVDGSDGTRFVADPGDRTQVALQPGPAGAGTASDPDLFHDGARWVLYVSRGNSTEVHTSPTLRGAYVVSPALPQGRLTNDTGGVGAGHFDALSRQYWTFVHRPDPVQRIYRAVHPGLATPLLAADLIPLVTGSSLGLGASFAVASPGIAPNANGPSLLQGSPAGTLETPASLVFQWQDLTRSPVYAVEYCVASGGATCFASQAGATRFDAPALTLWAVDGSDPAMRGFVGTPLGAGPVLAYTRADTTDTTVTLALAVGRLAAQVQYRVFPIVLSASPAGTLDAPDLVRSVVDLPPGTTSSLPVSVTLR